MTEPWRNDTDDEREIELSDATLIILDRVSGDVELPGLRGLANLTIIGGRVAATLQEQTPDDLRRFAAALIEFADLLDGVDTDGAD